MRPEVNDGACGVRAVRGGGLRFGLADRSDGDASLRDEGVASGTDYVGDGTQSPRATESSAGR